MSGIDTNRTSFVSGNIPPELSREIMQKIQEDSAVMQLARETTLSGRGETIPVILGDPEASWVSETGKKPVSNPSITTKLMTPYTLSVIVPFSNQFRRDAAALYDEIVRRLPGALGAKFDKTVLGGVEKPGDNFDNFAAVSAYSMDSDVYSALVSADTDVSLHGGIVDGWLISPQMRGVLLGATDTTKRPLFVNNTSEGAIPTILGAKSIIRKNAFVAGSPNVIGVAGDWSQALWGMVEGVDISYSDQATITIDNELVNLWERNMFAVRAEIEVGFRADTSVFAAISKTSVPSA
jgi:HK97 family phage major capsid protein